MFSKWLCNILRMITILSLTQHFIETKFGNITLKCNTPNGTTCATIPLFIAGDMKLYFNLIVLKIRPNYLFHVVYRKETNLIKWILHAGKLERREKKK